MGKIPIMLFICLCKHKIGIFQAFSGIINVHRYNNAILCRTLHKTAVHVESHDAC